MINLCLYVCVIILLSYKIISWIWFMWLYAPWNGEKPLECEKFNLTCGVRGKTMVESFGGLDLGSN